MSASTSGLDFVFSKPGPSPVRPIALMPKPRTLDQMMAGAKMRLQRKIDEDDMKLVGNLDSELLKSMVSFGEEVTLADVSSVSWKMAEAERKDKRSGSPLPEGRPYEYDDKNSNFNEEMEKLGTTISNIYQRYEGEAQENMTRRQNDGTIRKLSLIPVAPIGYEGDFTEHVFAKLSQLNLRYSVALAKRLAWLSIWKLRLSVPQGDRRELFLLSQLCKCQKRGSLKTINTIWKWFHEEDKDKKDIAPEIKEEIKQGGVSFSSWFQDLLGVSKPGPVEANVSDAALSYLIRRDFLKNHPSSSHSFKDSYYLDDEKHSVRNTNSNAFDLSFTYWQKRMQNPDVDLLYSIREILLKNPTWEIDFFRVPYLTVMTHFTDKVEPNWHGVLPTRDSEVQEVDLHGQPICPITADAESGQSIIIVNDAKTLYDVIPDSGKIPPRLTALASGPEEMVVSNTVTAISGQKSVNLEKVVNAELLNPFPTSNPFSVWNPERVSKISTSSSPSMLSPDLSQLSTIAAPPGISIAPKPFTVFRLPQSPNYSCAPVPTVMLNSTLLLLQALIGDRLRKWFENPPPSNDDAKSYPIGNDEDLDIKMESMYPQKPTIIAIPPKRLRNDREMTLNRLRGYEPGQTNASTIRNMGTNFLRNVPLLSFEEEDEEEDGKKDETKKEEEDEKESTFSKLWKALTPEQLTTHFYNEYHVTPLFRILVLSLMKTYPAAERLFFVNSEHHHREEASIGCRVSWMCLLKKADPTLVWVPTKNDPSPFLSDGELLGIHSGFDTKEASDPLHKICKFYTMFHLDVMSGWRDEIVTSDRWQWREDVPDPVWNQWLFAEKNLHMPVDYRLYIEKIGVSQQFLTPSTMLILLAICNWSERLEDLTKVSETDRIRVSGCLWADAIRFLPDPQILPLGLTQKLVTLYLNNNKDDSNWLVWIDALRSFTGFLLAYYVTGSNYSDSERKEVPFNGILKQKFDEYVAAINDQTARYSFNPLNNLAYHQAVHGETIKAEDKALFSFMLSSRTADMPRTWLGRKDNADLWKARDLTLMDMQKKMFDGVGYEADKNSSLALRVENKYRQKMKTPIVKLVHALSQNIKIDAGGWQRKRQYLLSCPDPDIDDSFKRELKNDDLVSLFTVPFIPKFNSEWSDMVKTADNLLGAEKKRICSKNVETSWEDRLLVAQSPRKNLLPASYFVPHYYRRWEKRNDANDWLQNNNYFKIVGYYNTLWTYEDFLEKQMIPTCIRANDTYEKFITVDLTELVFLKLPKLWKDVLDRAKRIENISYKVQGLPSGVDPIYPKGFKREYIGALVAQKDFLYKNRKAFELYFPNATAPPSKEYTPTTISELEVHEKMLSKLDEEAKLQTNRPDLFLLPIFETIRADMRQRRVQLGGEDKKAAGPSTPGKENASQNPPPLSSSTNASPNVPFTNPTPSKVSTSFYFNTKAITEMDSLLEDKNRNNFMQNNTGVNKILEVVQKVMRPSIFTPEYFTSGDLTRLRNLKTLFKFLFETKDTAALIANSSLSSRLEKAYSTLAKILAPVNTVFTSKDFENKFHNAGKLRQRFVASIKEFNDALKAESPIQGGRLVLKMMLPNDRGLFM